VVREVLERVVPALRAVGFRGSGQTYRKSEGDFVFVVNFQKSRFGDEFFVNLGAQPVFIPAEGSADLARLKEYECVLRRRVRGEWRMPLAPERLDELHDTLMSTQREFFGHAQSLRAALATDSADVLVRRFSAGTTQARATLHLARAAQALGHRERARALARYGLELAGPAMILVADLAAMLESLDR
jgi:hypothetical protein